MKAKNLQFFKKNPFSSLHPLKTIRAIEDKVLISKTKSGDENAYGKIYDVYIKEIYRFIYLKVASREEAEDITQSVFLKVWQYIKNRKSRIKNLRAFLYQTARHLVIDYYRRKKTLVLDVKTIEQTIDKKTTDEIEQKFDHRQQFENLEQALFKLQDKYQEVLVLKFVEDLSISEIAKILGKSKGTVRVLVHRALKELRKKLRNWEIINCAMPCRF